MLIQSTTKPTQKTIKGKNQITNSAMGCFKTCRRKYYYSYEKGIRPAREKKPLRFGRIFHDGLDYLAKEWTIDEACGAVEKAYDETIMRIPDFADSEIFKLEVEKRTCQTLLRGYIKVWSASPMKVLESETTFCLPITNPKTNRAMRTFKQAGKRDRLAKLPDGRLALVETKTVGQSIEPGSDYRNVLSINQQLSMYILSCQAEGLEVQTSIYDCIRKPTIRPNKGMTPDEWSEKLKGDIEKRPEYYYQRFEVPRLQTDLDEFKNELWDIAKDIHHCRKNGLYYRNTAACRNYNSLCPYYVFCSGEASIENLPETFRIVNTVHEELQD